MQDALSFQDKLSKFYQILNIPIRHQWVDNLQNDRNNWYYYLKSLGLISSDDFKSVYSEQKELQPNPTLSQYMKNIDSVFIDRAKGIETCVDVGAGWGWITCWMLLSGSKTIYALGDPSRTEYIKRIVSLAQEEGLLPSDIRCEFVCRFVGPGDLKFDDKIPANQVDLILLNDTLEHLTDRIRETFFKAAAYHLKPGGILISRCHNSNSPSMYKKLQAHWAKFEQDKGKRLREKFILERFPNIPSDVLAQLVDSLYGLDSIDAQLALNQYNESGKIPPPNRMLPPMSIDIDVVEEGLTGTERILPLIKAAGLQPKAYPFMSNRRSTRFLQPIARLVPNLFFKIHVGDGQIVYEARKA